MAVISRGSAPLGSGGQVRVTLKYCINIYDRSIIAYETVITVSVTIKSHLYSPVKCCDSFLRSNIIVCCARFSHRLHVVRKIRRNIFPWSHLLTACLSFSFVRLLSALSRSFFSAFHPSLHLKKASFNAFHKLPSQTRRNYFKLSFKTDIKNFDL